MAIVLKVVLTINCVIIYFKRFNKSYRCFDYWLSNIAFLTGTT